jgi:hypothetical protein
MAGQQETPAAEPQADKPKRKRPPNKADAPVKPKPSPLQDILARADELRKAGIEDGQEIDDSSKHPGNAVLIATLEMTKGIKAMAARALNVRRQTIHNWIEAEPRLQEAVREIRETNLDLAEAKALNKALNEGDSDLLRFYLRCFGKDRGWIEVHHIAGADGGALKIEHTSAPDTLAGIDPNLLELDELRHLRELSRIPAHDLSGEQFVELKRLHAKAKPKTIEMKLVETAALPPPPSVPSASV